MLRRMMMAGAGAPAGIIASQSNYNGSNGSTTITDDTGKSWTCYGNAKLSTTNPKYGSACLALDGVGSYAATPSSTDFDFGSGDFCIEAWVRPENSSASNYYGILSRDQIGGTRGWLLFTDLTNGNLNFTAWNGGTSKTVLKSGNFLSDYLNSYVHVAVARDGDNLRLFVAGALIQTLTGMTGFSVASAGVPLRVGSLLGAGGSNPFFNGRIDSHRITKGSPVYTAAFTPPAAEFPAS